MRRLCVGVISIIATLPFLFPSIGASENTGPSASVSKKKSFPSGSTTDLSPLRLDDFDDGPRRSLLRHNARLTLTVVGVLTLVGSQDRSLKGEVPEFFSNTLGGLEGEKFGKRGTTVERLGRMPGAAQVAGGFYMTGVITGSVNARRVGILALEAKVVNDLVTTGLKRSIGRERPGSPTSDGDEFHPFGNSTAFPSGHTSSAFALATVVADNYESKWVKFVSYGLATAVGLGRINQGAHWASDVAGGALVGYGVGKLISRFERRKGWSRALYFEGNGVSVKKRFQ